MKLPPVAPFPPTSLREGVAPGDWEACIDAWTALVTMHLRLSAQDFTSHSIKDDSLVAFLTSYMHEASNLSGGEIYIDGLKLRSLRRECFLLAHRFLSEDRIPSTLLDWAFLADFCSTYVKSTSLRELFGELWRRHEGPIELGLRKLRQSLVRDLENTNSGGTECLASTLSRIGPLLYVSQDVSRFFMVGSDFLDALSTGYLNAPPSLRRRIVTTTYLGLISLLGPNPNLSLLLDHLYGLKNLADTGEKKGQRTETLISELVTNTPLLRKLRDQVHGTDAARAKGLVSLLEAFHNPKEKWHIRRKANKGKGRAATDESGQEPSGGKIHVHRMSLVTQIQDLFPNLESGFIMELLDEYGNDTELVTLHLLEGSLPPHLRNAGRTEELCVSP
jgi:activating signal cointegrator complex subunit 2